MELFRISQSARSALQMPPNKKSQFSHNCTTQQSVEALRHEELRKDVLQAMKHHQENRPTRNCTANSYMYSYIITKVSAGCRCFKASAFSVEGLGSLRI